MAHTQHSDAPVTRVKQHAVVLCESLERAPVPSCALSRENRECLWRFGPAYRLGHESDPVGSLLFAKVAVQADDQFHVLADGLWRVAPNFYKNGASEKTKGARYNCERPYPAPCDPGQQKGAQIFHGLEQGPNVARHADLDYAPIAYGAAVCNAHG